MCLFYLKDVPPPADKQILAHVTLFGLIKFLRAVIKTQRLNLFSNVDLVQECRILEGERSYQQPLILHRHQDFIVLQDA